MHRGRLNMVQLVYHRMFFSTGLLALKRKMRPRNTITVLAYHTLESPRFLRNVLGIHSSESDFNAQINYIASHHTVLSMSELLSILSFRMSAPENAVVITFDDGYADVYNIAYPRMKALGLPGTVFLTTEAVTCQRSIWTNRLYGFIEAAANRKVTIEFDGRKPLTVDLTDSHSRMIGALAVCGMLKTMSPEERLTALHAVARALGVDPQFDPIEQLPMLSWDQVAILHREGFTIGSHSVTHPILSMCSEERQWMELSESKQEIETRLNAPCRVLAYPNGQPGDISDATRAIAKECGYEAGFRFTAGPVRSGIDPFDTPRHPVFEVPLASFAVALA